VDRKCKYLFGIRRTLHEKAIRRQRL